MSRPVVSPADAALRDLELHVRTTVEGLRQGLHRSPFHGFNAEFSQYRRYHPGDDLKHVDWKAFARTDRLFTRQFRETTSMGVLFALDISRSMGLPRSGSKLMTAAVAAGALATLVIDQGDAAGVLALGEATHYVPPRSGSHHLQVALATLARLEPGAAVPPAVTLRRVAALMRRPGLVVVFSDFYEDAEALSEVRRLTRAGHEVIVVQLTSRDELELTASDATEFIDVETEQRIDVDAARLRDTYRRQVEAFLSGMARAVAAEGLHYLRLVAGEPVEPALRRFLIARRAASERQTG
ncbi:MAG: DUF58 domain-containing protein [Acidobacteriota bacterium]